MAEKIHAMHGRDHLATGSDPIPGIGGIQFHSGIYGTDNVGDYLVIEATSSIPSNPYSNTANSDPSGFSAGIATANGIDITTIENGTNSLALSVTVDRAAAGEAWGQDISVKTHDGSSKALAESVVADTRFGGSRAAEAQGIKAHALAYHGNAYGMILGGSAHDGNAWGLQVGAKSDSGVGYGIQVVDDDPVANRSANPLFEVRADGTIHGKASVGAITWDL